ncbi:phage tail assembly chaperone [Serratia proteamaculans]
MEFELKGQQYRTAKLNVFDQLKVSRKLLPILAGMMSDFKSIKDDALSGNAFKALDTALPKIADALADMSDEDTNAIIFPCLSVVSRQHGKGWKPVFTQGALMFDDIDLMVMLQMVGRVVGDSLGNFLPETPASETQDLPAA